jgi:acyl-CoA reductase-like NAD-dependent aldehyde dehydrogenase
VGAALAADPHIKGMWFTGSHATGRKIAAAAAPNMVRLNLELGGKDAAYVRADVDVQKVRRPMPSSLQGQHRAGGCVTTRPAGLPYP